MKKLIVTLVVIGLACTFQAQGQDQPKEKKSFWDKLDNATNKVLGLPTDQKCTTAGYETATIRSFSKEVDFILESCINDGKTLILSFYLNNRGKELDISGFSNYINPLSEKRDYAKFIDDLGNEYEVCYNAVGKSIRTDREGVSFVLSEGVKVKGEIRVPKFNSRAKTLQLVNIVGNIRTGQQIGVNQYQSLNIILKNVPVYTPAQILSQSKTLFTKDMPAVEAQTDKDYVVKSVVITEENTQVTFTYTNSRGYQALYVDNNMGGIFLTANGKEYPLTAYYYIAGNITLAIKNYGINGGATADFTLVFEKIPETTNVLNINFGDLTWNNVWLVEPPKPAVTVIKEKTDLERMNIKGSVASVTETGTGTGTHWEHNDATTTTYNFNKDGMLTSINRTCKDGNGKVFNATVKFTYNDKGQLEKREVNFPDDIYGWALYKHQELKEYECYSEDIVTFKYNAVGQLIEETRSREDVKRKYEYNAKGQVITDGSWRYKYDNAGNITVKCDNDDENYIVANYTYNSQNRIISMVDYLQDIQECHLEYNTQGDYTKTMYGDQFADYILYFTYIYDQQNNWTKRETRAQDNKKVIGTTTRTIVYNQ